MNLYAAFKQYNEHGEQAYSVTDLEGKPDNQVELAEMIIWPGTEGGWGFTVTGQMFGDVVTDHTLVESGQQNYDTVESAIKHGLADLNAFYMSDPDGV